MDDKYCGTDTDVASKRMLDAAGVKYRKAKKIKINLECEND